MVTVLNDADVARLADMADLVEVWRTTLAGDATGSVAAPPRIAVDVDPGSLVFTVGGDHDAIGVRVHARGIDGADDQVVAVCDRAGGGLDGLVVGSALGALRTGAIGGVAVDLLARARQARTQLLATAAVRDLATVRVHARTPDRRDAFAAEMGDRLGMDVQAVGTVNDAVDGADVVLLATTSPEPVVASSVLTAGVHVSTVGPKTRTAHEWPVELATAADVVATDSPQQVAAWGDEHLLAGRPVGDRVVHLGRLAADGVGRRDDDDQRTLFLSVGLAGTEVAVARHLLARQGAV